MLFEKEIQKISNRYHTSQVFDDFLQMAVCAFSLGKSEDIYLERAKKYNAKELEGFSNALGALMLDHENTNGIDWKDFLGNYFESHGQYNAKSGQFFTPVSLCNIIAQLVESNEGESVNDPSCGSSRNLIAHAQLDPNNRYKYFYFGQDLDKRCCLMSVLNFVMFGMKGIIIHMNTISLEVYSGWRIYLPETGLGVVPLSVDECKYFLFDKKTEESTKQIVNVPESSFQQLKLF
jgi:type I restriction-modification system DNA methylase subunit